MVHGLGLRLGQGLWSCVEFLAVDYIQKVGLTFGFVGDMGDF